MSVTTFFWFAAEAEEAATFYTSVVPNSRIVDVTRHPDGSAFVVSLDLDGQSVTLMNGGPDHPLTDAASLQLLVDTQAEIDHLWTALTEGGVPGPCGWLTDRYGLSWQVVPAAITKLMSGDPTKAAALGAALGTMSKLDLQALQDAYNNA